MNERPSTDAIPMGPPGTSADAGPDVGNGATSNSDERGSRRDDHERGAGREQANQQPGLGDLAFVGESNTLKGLATAPEFELPGRGTIRLRDLPGPGGAPVVVLLHGWTATADLNFFRCYEALAERYRVIAYDHRGHGYGLRTKAPFQLSDAADDAIAVLDALKIDSAIMVGYSMGGTIAQLTWKQHRERVDGLVLGATAPYFSEHREERLSFMGLGGLAKLARIAPEKVQDWVTEQFYLGRKEEVWGEDAMRQISIHDWRSILEAGQAIGAFNSTGWLSQIDVPTSVIVTLRDPVVRPSRQIELWEAIRGSQVFRVDGAHDAIVNNSGRFVPQMIRAIEATRQTTIEPDHPSGG